MQSLIDIASDFTALIAAGQLQAAAEKYWAQDVAIINPDNQPDSMPCIAKGLVAARQRLASWISGHAVEDLMVDGPFITGENFALFFDMELVNRATGKRRPFSKIAVYTVCDGKITEERHFHG